MTSVNTNSGAMIALESLNQTNSQLAVAQKQVATGFRVADATDDGAAFAIAQSVRSTVGALTSANQELGASQGLLSTTSSALTHISSTMASMRDVLVSLADANVTGNARTQDVTKYNTLASQVQSYVKDASYNGKTLIGDISGSQGTFGSVEVASNDAGKAIVLAAVSGSALYGSLSMSAAGNGSTPALAQAMLAVGTLGAAAGASTAGVFVRMQNSVGGDLNAVGSSVNQVNNQISYNSDKIDALNTGLGSMVDADLAKVSASITSLQIRQQLGTQELSLANQAPQSLLSLFK
jgi:flagellin